MSDWDWDLLSSYAGLLTLATLSVYTGSFGSLPPAKRNRKTTDGADHVAGGESSEDEDEEVPERLSSEDAWLFPVIGSVLLLGLYATVKYFGKEWINWLLRWYFTLAGIGSGSKALISLVRWVIGPVRWRQYDLIKVKALKGPKELFVFSLRTPSLYLIPLGALPSVLYTLGGPRSAVLTDVLALSFAFNALSLLTIDSFKTGCILLSGLFFYDVWWVFGTEVMVKVATTLDVPIKLLWAKSATFATERGFTMLGLGDVVVPGMFVALALRYDHHRALQKAASANANVTATDGFAKPYFYAATAAYAGGLGTTMTVMHAFRAAQPALLYLSPACILSFVATALSRGELVEAWGWADETPSGGGGKGAKEDGGKELKEDGGEERKEDGGAAGDDEVGHDEAQDTAVRTSAVSPGLTSPGQESRSRSRSAAKGAGAGAAVADADAA